MPTRSELRERFELRRKRIADDQQALAQLLARGGSGATPANIDLPGVTWLLGAVYSEIEEVAKGVAKYFGEPLPSAPTWHQDLLDMMARPGTGRGAVISDETRVALEELLAFRHFSRNSTFPVLRWDRMEPLVATLGGVVKRFEAEVEAFLDRSGL